MILKLALKNIISRKSSIVIVLFIAFAVATLVVTNAIFDSTENGIQETFVSSFTGDIVIRPKAETPLSLLGDETPITGSFVELPLLTPYSELVDYLKTLPQIKRINPQVSGMAALNYKGQIFPSVIFGTETPEYFKIMDAVEVQQGRAFNEDEDGMMLSTQIANKIGADLGSDIQFVVSEGLTARIRSTPVTGIYAYPIENSVFDQIVIMNPETARELLGMDSMYDSEDLMLDDKTENLLSDYDLDSLFEMDDSEAFSTSEVENQITESTEAYDAASIDLNMAEDTSWNFLICDVENNDDIPSVIKKLNKKFSKSGWNIEAVNWRNAAGSNAMYLYFLRLILNIGIIIVLFAGFIIINNTLVVNILDRVQEIGTMRAIGTSRLFVSLQCMTETLLLALIAGILGLILGCLLSQLVLSLKITFYNTFLIQLFGGNHLVTIVKASNLFKCFCVSMVLGMVAWIYPVHTALSTPPVTAMTGAK